MEASLSDIRRIERLFGLASRGRTALCISDRKRQVVGERLDTTDVVNHTGAENSAKRVLRSAVPGHSNLRDSGEIAMSSNQSAIAQRPIAP